MSSELGVAVLGLTPVWGYMWPGAQEVSWAVGPRRLGFPVPLGRSALG